MKPIFEYLDYREYLRDYYADKKAEHSFYSLRLFSEKAGFKSPNYLKLVMDGERNISSQSIPPFVKGLGLNRAESLYFERLVTFTQAKSLDDKNAALAQLMKQRTGGPERLIEKSEYRYYSRWYHPVIRELVVAHNFKDDFAALAAVVVPPILPEEAEASVALLVDLGFIRKNRSGKYSAGVSVLSTGPVVRSVAVASYHRVLLKLAAEAIERIPASDRDISSLTLGVTTATALKISEKVKQFRKEILELASQDEGADKVMQLDMQLFPVSKTLPLRRLS